MNRSISLLIITSLIVGFMATASAEPIIHSVFFKLKHEAGSQAEADFIKKARGLASIPGVDDFKVLREVSPKNDWRWGLSMKFKDQAAYDGYNKHPDHVRFVQEVWFKEVADFQEVDYVEDTQN
jgi:hypothetical protein